ncbi:MAG: MaoC family dehydratase [Gammaproteobacteria bacterium]
MPYFDDVKAGDTLPTLTKGPVTRQHLVEWCAAENDYYHLHYDERVAARMKLPGTPIQGTYKFAMLGQLVGRWLGGSGELVRIDCAYKDLSLEGDTLTAGGSVARCEPGAAGGAVTLELWVANGDGTRSTLATAHVRLPRRA